MTARAPLRHDAATLRADELRRDVIQMISIAGSGHPGGSLSAAEIMAALYGSVLRVDPANPRWAGRDRLVFSKGHGAPILYAALAARGFFPRDHLATLRKIGSILQGHPDARKTPGVDMTTGSLGQGLSVGLGMALAVRHLPETYHVFVLMSDGELQEGQVWEAAMCASHHRAGNLTAIIDRNMIQQSGPTEDVVRIEPLVDKWSAFGWDVVECDGHDAAAVEALLIRRRASEIVAKPGVVICHTVKGKGVSFMEDVVGWHHGAPSEDELSRALKEIDERLLVELRPHVVDPDGR